MFGKLLLIIVVVGAVACALLVIRQQRIDTFHEIAQVHVRLLDHERTLWQMREEIAERCRPSQVRLAMDDLGLEWSPLPATPFDARQTEIRLASQQQTVPDARPVSTKPSTPSKPPRGRKPGA